MMNPQLLVSGLAHIMKVLYWRKAFNVLCTLDRELASKLNNEIDAVSS